MAKKTTKKSFQTEAVQNSKGNKNRYGGMVMEREKIAVFLSRLDRAELTELNQMVIRQCRALDRENGIKESVQYSVGQTISFRHKRAGRIEWIPATVDRVNQKTLSITDAYGGLWRASYAYCRPA